MFDHGILSKTMQFDALGPWIIDQAGSSTSGGGPSGVRGAERARQDPRRHERGAGQVGVGGDRRRTAPRSGETSSAADGTYVFSGLSAGTYTVTAGKDGYADNQRTVVVVGSVADERPEHLAHQIRAPGHHGTRLHRRRPLPHLPAHVKLYDADDDSPFAGPIQSDWTYADGAYSFIGIDPGNYRVVASISYYHPESVTVSLAGGQLRENVDLFLVQLHAQGVFGRVVDSLTRDPLEGALVKAHAGRRERQGGGLGRHRRATDPSS